MGATGSAGPAGFAINVSQAEATALATALWEASTRRPAEQPTGMDTLQWSMNIFDALEWAAYGAAITVRAGSLDAWAHAVNCLDWLDDGRADLSSRITGSATVANVDSLRWLIRKGLRQSSMGLPAESHIDG